VLAEPGNDDRGIESARIGENDDRTLRWGHWRFMRSSCINTLDNPSRQAIRQRAPAAASRSDPGPRPTGRRGG
jgi:hypothetical protein